MLNPMELLQFKIMFMDDDTFIKYDKIFFISKVKAHYCRIKNSLRYFQNGLKDFTAADEQNFEQLFQVYLEFITKYLEVTKYDSKLIISADLRDGVTETAPIATKLEALENRLRKLCANDWSKPCNLTDPRECLCDKLGYTDTTYTLKNYAFIAQCLLNFNPLKAMRRPMVSASLLTHELTQTYWNRNVGLLYRMTPDNLILFGVSDLNSNVVSLVQDNDVIATIFDWSWFQQCYHVDVTEDEDSAYYPFDVFVDLCKKRCGNVDIKELDKYNEVLLHPDFMNDVIGAFYRYDSLENEVCRVKSFAEMSHVPVVRFNQDGSATVFKKIE